MPLADRSVAVLNRGTPGCVVTPDGTLHMSLMRSCSAWPSGIWIDGDRRTAPDGSSFAWQHWSHTFEYALASGPGDWRAAGFSLVAEDYNHDLLTVTTGPGPARRGRCRLSRVLGRSRRLSVEPATVTLSAFKPRGNPLASGRTKALSRRPRRHRHRAAAGNQRAADHGPGPARGRRPGSRRRGSPTCSRSRTALPCR